MINGKYGQHPSRHVKNEPLTSLNYLTCHLLFILTFDPLNASTCGFTFLLKDWMQCSVSPMQFQTGARLDWYNQRSCFAEAYKTRGRSLQGRKLRHLVTSKAGRNQASGSFLSAVCCSRYTAGYMVGGLSWLLTELMTKTLFWLFLHRLLADQKRAKDSTFTDSRKNLF